MNPELKLLMLEDNPDDAMLIQTLLKRSGLSFNATVAGDEHEFLAAIVNNGYDAVLADNALPQYSSLEALKIIKEKNPHVAFLLVTGTVSEEFAVSIIQQGADDYILKTNLTRLPAALTKAIEKKRIQREKVMEKELSDSIINSLPGIFYFYTATGDMIRWNKNLEAVSGFDSLQIRSMTPKGFFEKKYAENVDIWMNKAFTNGYAETEAPMITKNGKKLSYFFTGSTVNFYNQPCLIGIGLDISARKQSEKELKQLNQDLRNVSAHLEKIREEEQTRIAREIHDQLGQQLTGLKMDLAWIKTKIMNRADPATLEEKLNDMSKMMDEAVVTVRKVASDLRPSILDDYGLVDALDWQSREFEKRSGIPVSFKGPEGMKIDPDTSTALFRIYQEALTNVARHAAAKNVTTILEQSPEKIVLLVKDDGKGFNMNQKKTLGLLGMKERAHLVGGTVSIISEAGRGTTVTVTVPLQ